MVRMLFPLILMYGLISSGIATAAPRIKLAADKRVMVLGEPLLVKISVEESRESLGKINLGKLKLDFNVYAISSSTQTLSKNGRSNKSETLTLTLYPLRTGKLQLPALSFMGNKSNSLVVTVNESGRNMSPVMIRATLDTLHPHVRQAATLTLDTLDDGNLLWTPPADVVAQGAHLRKLAQSRREEMVEGIRYTVHRHAWALMPLREGAMKVEFPMLDASKLGMRLRYPVAPLKFDVAAIPAYLPVHLPIGKIEVSQAALPAEISLARPVNWIISVKGSGLSVEGLGKMMTSVRSTASLQFYPALISSEANERPETPEQILRVTLPFTPLQSGELALPDLNLAYYDTASMKVESVYIPGQKIEVFNPLWRTMQKIALGFILLAGGAGLTYWFYKKLLLELTRRKQLGAISRAVNADDLRRALLNFGVGGEAGTCITLHQWLQRMKQTYLICDKFAEVVEKLSSAQYGAQGNAENVSALAGEAVKLLQNLRVRKLGVSKL